MKLTPNYPARSPPLEASASPLNEETAARENDYVIHDFKKTSPRKLKSINLINKFYLLIKFTIFYSFGQTYIAQS